MATQQERAELHKTIWKIANDLRGSVDGWEFKAYVLGSIFYRFISENICDYIQQLIQLNYPNPIVRKTHMGFYIIPLEMDTSYLVNHNLIEKLLAMNPDNKKGTPVFIEP